MEKVIKLRTIVRSKFTRNYNALQKHLIDNNKVESKATFCILTEKWFKLKEYDEEVLQFMVVKDELTDEDYEKEEEVQNEYETKYNIMKIRIDNIEMPTGNRIGSTNYYDDDQISVSTVNCKNIKLPAMKLDTFDGNLKSWLPFWGQFEIIHNDDSIPTFHKFRILSQSLKEGSRAKQVVDSFPISKEIDNYNAAVEALKERFGREDLLIEVYIRELLEMIVQNSKSHQFSLPDMYDRLECQLRFLEILGVTTGKSAAILCPLLESCMSEEFLRVWQRSYASDEVKDAEKRLDKFREFIKAEVQNEQRISLAMTKFGISDNSNDKKYRQNSSVKCFKQGQKKELPSALGLLTTHENRQTCIFCGLFHNSIDCYKARDMTLDEKLKYVREAKCCYLCLKKSHSSKQCRIKVSCLICDKRHANILCPNLARIKSVKNTFEPEQSNPGQVSGDSTKRQDMPVVTTTASLTCDATVLLPTLKLRLKNRNGKTCIVRAVIDTASQRSYVLNSTASKMNLEDNGNEKLCISLFGGKRSNITYHTKFVVPLSNLKGDFKCVIEALGQDFICGDLPTVPCGPWIEEMASYGINVSDLLNDSGPVELLLGADVACTFFTGNVKKLTDGSLVALETYLGWTISGRIPNQRCKKSPTAATLTTNMLCNNMNVSDLWRLDLLGIDDSTAYKTKEDIEAETNRFFLETVNVNEEGRYEVCLPWKRGHCPLPTNFELASKRLHSLNKKLQMDGFHQEYDTVLNEWVNEGVITEIQISDEGHFLPHRHVVKLNSTTKIRPVFDASARQKNTSSLNECLERGSNLIEQIPALLHQFRMKKIGVIADIRRAFLQISVNPNDRQFLKFLWTKSDGELMCYQHNRVVFGLTSSPYLLGAVIQYHLKKTHDLILQGNLNYAVKTVDILSKCFYVDNVVTSLDSIEDLNTFQTEATAILAEGKFDLRSWESTDLLNGPDENLFVLGLKWNKKEDNLIISTDNLNLVSEKVTKRIILSAAHRFFDPLGIASPVTICPKLLLKELWELKVSWDEEVPSDIREKFLKWVKELSYLQNVRVPRWILTSHVINMSIHTFCDASESSYATVIFVRVENEFEVKIQLVQSKTRISPLKKITIPRLELLAANIGARLFNHIKEFFNGSYDVYFWTDSTTVLAWLKRNENWATFVSNRVSEIQKLTNTDQWHHIPGKSNPADLPSRGCLGKALSESNWWEGPEWLYKPPNEWPTSECNFNEEDIVSEKKLTVVSSMMTTKDDSQKINWYYTYFSQYLKLIRMFAWICRFIYNCKVTLTDSGLLKKGQLTVEEINQAELNVLRLVQKEAFGDIKNKKIISLQPFKDHEGLIRLRTKISNRVDSIDFRFPILLPKDHPVVTRLLKYIHEKECHIGIQGLLGITRERFWVLGGRRTMKKIVSSCVVCKRYSSKPLEVSTPALPFDRVRQAAAFEIVGVDLAGPTYLQDAKKCWICLFTCGVYRAIHLELLISLSAEDFVLALRRFVSRRGRPATIYSDRGTNFRGADNLFRKVEWSKVREYCDVNRISWKFNPPSAPWWGGWWERLIGLTKNLLRRVLRRSTLTYIEMETVLCDCESVLNSRPLTFQAEGSSEPIPITPSMFIQDIREAGLPELDTVESSSFNKKWQYRLQLKKNFRDRFRIEYLGLLKSRSKQIKTKPIEVGDIVLIGNDSSKRMDWPLGKVVEVIPGRDCVVRLVKLQTAAGVCMRPIQRLYRLLEGQE